MTWNWEQPDWPNFIWDAKRLTQAERQFLLGGGILVGTLAHLGEQDRSDLVVELMSAEATTTSEIEGEILDRASVKSSIQTQLGLAAERRRVAPKEQGVAEMMVDLYRSYEQPTFTEELFKWHRWLMSGSQNLSAVGHYRSGHEPMQVTSGSLESPRVHFEAPPSHRVPFEMARFIEWLNGTGPSAKEPLPALTRAGIAHLYFESIHPFEDGNGRIGRAISEKSLAQSLQQPLLVGLSTAIFSHRSKYYRSLEAASKQNDITDWLAWFAGVAIEAQRRTVSSVEFLIFKTQLFDRLRGQINGRQEKTLLRVFKEGPQGFRGGLSAANYVAITGASTASATRDLADLVEKQALTRTGEYKSARYRLPTSLNLWHEITISEDGTIVDGVSNLG